LARAIDALQVFQEEAMRVVSLLVALTFTANPAIAQSPQPIHASIERAAAAGSEQTASPSTSGRSAGKRALFWTGLATSIAGVTTSALGLTAFRTEDSSTGNAPRSTYLACVEQKNSNAVYATNQCDALKGKNLKLLWGGAALGGLGAVLMITGTNTSAELSSGAIGVFHHWKF
jgi:hypothetical protein